MNTEKPGKVNTALQQRTEGPSQARLEAERQAFSVVRRAVDKTRLIVEGGATVSAADVLSKLNAALTEYGKGELGVALSLVRAAAGLYQDKLNRWEGLVRQREESVKERSVQKFRQIQGVHNPIRTNTRQIPSNFQHLADCLEERIKKEGKSDKEPRREKIEADVPVEPPGPSIDTATLLSMLGIQALVRLVGDGLEFKFSRAKLKPTFRNAALREQVWQNRALALVVTWSNGNRVVDANSAPLILHLWVIPKTLRVMKDLEHLTSYRWCLENVEAETSETILFTPAKGKTPATPYNKDVKSYIAAKARELQEAAPNETIAAVYTDTVYTNRPFAQACEEPLVLKLPKEWLAADAAGRK